MSELVKVKITIEKRDRYSTTVQMTKEEFQEWDSKLDSSTNSIRESAKDHLGECVDGHDWIGGEVESIDEFEIVGSVTQELKESEEYRKAIDLVIQEQKASISFVQRHLKASYNRAALIIETMQEDGLISEPNENGTRTVLKQPSSNQE